MQAFLLGNLSNGGILELMMRFLKSMGHRFLLRWPPGLAEVVLSTYHSWRRHSASLPNPLLRDCSNRHIQVGLRGALAPLPWRRTAASRGNAGAFRAPRGGGAPAHRCSGAPGQQPLLGHSCELSDVHSGPWALNNHCFGTGKLGIHPGQPLFWMVQELSAPLFSHQRPYSQHCYWPPVCAPSPPPHSPPVSLGIRTTQSIPLQRP